MKLRSLQYCFALSLVFALSTTFAAAQSAPAPADGAAAQAASQPAAAGQTTSSQTPAAPQTTTSPAPAAAGQNATSQTPADNQATDPLKRPLSEQEKKKSSKALKQELSSTYKKWLNQDVIYIITPEEKSAFKQLSNDEERDQFIEQFWLRRDPTPDTPENEYKEEHYRRIAYANEHFGAGLPGWRTDRGRIYITWGAPDQITSHPSGGMYDRSQAEGGGSTSTFPFEDWRYRYLEGIGENIELEFVDDCMCGNYKLAQSPNDKDALLHTPGGATQYESMGLSAKTDRMDPFASNPGTMQALQNSHEFDKMETLAKVQSPPPVKFKDLEEVVSHKINVSLMPFEVRTDFVKVTDDTVMVPVIVKVQNKDITFASKDGIQRGTVNIFGRVTGITGKVAQTFEDTVQVDVPQELLEKEINFSKLYWKAIPLRPGRYRLDIVVKDVNGDRVGTWTRGIMVPEFADDKLASSSLILADKMEKVATKDVGSGNFVIGETKLAYPHLDGADGKPASFSKDQRMSLWMQVYNLQSDDKTKKPSANIEYEIVNLANNQAVLHSTESTATMAKVGEQITLEKSLSLNTFQPGLYRLTVKVDDNVSKQQIAPSVRFAVQ
jgi:GWxTD domain-containing protein